MTTAVLIALIDLLGLGLLVFLVFKRRKPKPSVAPAPAVSADPPLFLLPDTDVSPNLEKIYVSGIQDFFQTRPEAQKIFSWIRGIETALFKGIREAELDTEVLNGLKKSLEDDPRKVLSGPVWEFLTLIEGGFLNTERHSYSLEIEARLAHIARSPGQRVSENEWKAIVYHQALTRLKDWACKSGSFFTKDSLSTGFLRHLIEMYERDLKRLEMSATGAEEAIPHVVHYGARNKEKLLVYLRHLQEALAAAPQRYSPPAVAEEEFQAALRELQSLAPTAVHRIRGKEALRRCKVASEEFMKALKNPALQETLKPFLEEEMKAMRSVEWEYNFDSRPECYARGPMRSNSSPAKEALDYLKRRLPLLEKFKTRGTLQPETLRSLMQTVEKYLAFLANEENLRDLTSEERNSVKPVTEHVRQKLTQLAS